MGGSKIITQRCYGNGWVAPYDTGQLNRTLHRIGVTDDYTGDDESMHIVWATSGDNRRINRMAVSRDGTYGPVQGFGTDHITTNSGPAPVHFNGTLYVVYLGEDDLFYCCPEKGAGSVATRIGSGQHAGGTWPTATQYLDRVYALFGDDDAPGGLWFASMGKDAAWTEWQQVLPDEVKVHVPSGLIEQGSAVGAAHYLESLYVAYPGDDNNYHYTTYDETGWTHPKQIPGAIQSSIEGDADWISLSAYKDYLLYAMYTTVDGNIRYQTFDGVAWSPPNIYLGDAAGKLPPFLPTLGQLNGTLYCVYNGSAVE